MHKTPDELLREKYDHRSFFKRRLDLVKSLFRQFSYVFAVFVYRLSRRMPRFEPRMESEGLIVLLHGLFYDPAVWYVQLNLLRKHPAIDIFAPMIPKKGVCSLEEAAKPLLPTIVSYAKMHPQAPICLVGVSNGGRIALWLETQLRIEAPGAPIFVSTVAGIHFGSTAVNLVDDVGIAKVLSPKVLRQELRYGSAKAREILEEVKTPLPLGCAPRAYEFYASTEDLSIPEIDSSLPTLGRGEKFYVLHGESHESIVAAVAEHQVNACLQWIRQNSAKS